MGVSDASRSRAGGRLEVPAISVSSRSEQSERFYEVGAWVEWEGGRGGEAGLCSVCFFSLLVS